MGVSNRFASPRRKVKTRDSISYSFRNETRFDWSFMRGVQEGCASHVVHGLRAVFHLLCVDCSFHCGILLHHHDERSCHNQVCVHRLETVILVSSSAKAMHRFTHRSTFRQVSQELRVLG